MFGNLFPHTPAQKGFLAFNWSFPCLESCLLLLGHVLGTSNKAQALHGVEISQMPPLPASIQYPCKGRQLLSCPGTPRDLCSSSQQPEPWFAQTGGPFRACGGSEGVEGSCSSLVSSWQPSFRIIQDCGMILLKCRAVGSLSLMSHGQEQSQLCKLEFLAFASGCCFIFLCVYSQPVT